MNKLTTILIIICLFLVSFTNANSRGYQVYKINPESIYQSKISHRIDKIEVKIKFPDYYDKIYIYICGAQDCDKSAINITTLIKKDSERIRHYEPKNFGQTYFYIRLPKGPIILYATSSYSGKTTIMDNLNVSYEQTNFKIP